MHNQPKDIMEEASIPGTAKWPPASHLLGTADHQHLNESILFLAFDILLEAIFIELSPQNGSPKIRTGD